MQEYNPFSINVEEVGGLDKIEELQMHVNQEVYTKAITILETYFQSEEVNEESGVVQYEMDNSEDMKEEEVVGMDSSK